MNGIRGEEQRNMTVGSHKHSNIDKSPSVITISLLHSPLPRYIRGLIKVLFRNTVLFRLGKIVEGAGLGRFLGDWHEL